MEVRKDAFPIAIQAYDTSVTPELFVAEQVVNSQAEIDEFTARFAGKLIKARAVSDIEYKRQPEVLDRKKSSTGAAILILVLIIVILAILGFATGWIQRNFNISI